jgi:putative acetyltransferase
VTPRVEIAEATAGDAPGVYAVTVAAFGQEDEAKLIVALAQEEAIVLALVARVEGRVAGAVVFSRVRLETPDGVAQGIALAPLAVAPALQRQGIGSSLVREGLGRLAAAGERVALVVGSPSYYGRFGSPSRPRRKSTRPGTDPICRRSRSAGRRRGPVAPSMRRRSTLSERRWRRRPSR